MTTRSNPPTQGDLLREIQQTLGNMRISPVTTSSAIWDLYEAYIFSIVVEAAEAEQASIELRTERVLQQSNLATQLLFRRGPGSLRVLRAPYTFATINFPGKPSLEAHVGVYVRGKSGIPHECDVVVLEEDAVIKAQINNEEPKDSKKVLFAVECKFYASDLGLDLARSFMGLTVESPSNKWFFISNISSPSVSQVLTENRRNWEAEIVPAAQKDVLRFRNQIQKLFRNYVAGR